MTFVPPSPRQLLALLGVALGLAVAGVVVAQSAPKAGAPTTPAKAPAAAPATTAVATFAGGCFWCMEPPYDKLAASSRRRRGHGRPDANPTYEEVPRASPVTPRSSRSATTREGQLRHAARNLLANVDPTVKDRQFCDAGTQYRSTIIVHTSRQLTAAEASKAAQAKQQASEESHADRSREQLWPAEDYHQDYYQKNPVRYSYYRSRCGRDQRLRQLWGDRAGTK